MFSAKVKHAIIGEKFTWILLQRDGFVKMSEDQATAHVSSLHFEPCVLRGKYKNYEKSI